MSLDTVGKKVRIESLQGDSLWRIVLDAPKANILDATMLEGLAHALVEAAKEPRLKALLFVGEGAHFSFGASVEEHRKAQVGTMLRAFHGVFRALARTSLATLAVVRGNCLGGGLELASFCTRVFAAPDAKLGQPEIKLGVMAPVASLVLPSRCGQAVAEDLCLSGRVIDAEQALAIGLVDEVAADPQARAVEWFQTHLAPHSAASLRRAVAAVRHGFLQRFLPQLDALERLYLEDLMATQDANEGIEAFLGKRKPVWRDA